jgi:hypothetical protein
MFHFVTESYILVEMFISQMWAYAEDLEKAKFEIETAGKVFERHYEEEMGL